MFSDSGKTCTTINTQGGYEGGSPCVFPWKFKGKTYNLCTMDWEIDQRPWCATKVDENGDVFSTNFGYCGANCPLEGKYNYRTRAIITRGLYIFYPLFILKSGLYYRQFMD